MAETDFERFYQAYPRKKAPRDAEKAWGQVEEDLPNIDVLVEIVQRHAAQPSWQEDRKHIPYPATWLRAHRWKDEVDSPEEARIEWWQRIGDVNSGADHDGAWDRKMPEALRRITEARDNWGLDDEAIDAILELKPPVGCRWSWYRALDSIHLLHCRRKWRSLSEEEREAMKEQATRESGDDWEERTYAEILIMLVEERFSVPPLAPFALSYAKKL